MELYTKENFIAMTKETPALSLEFLAKKLNELAKEVRNSKCCADSKAILEELKFIQQSFINEIDENVDQLSVYQSISLPDLIDLDTFDPANYSA